MVEGATMTLHERAQAIIEVLTERGLPFSRFTTPDGLGVMHPARWHPTWEKDHVSIVHGAPAQGWLTLFPAIIDEPITSKALLLAFLDELVAEVGERYELLELGESDRHPGLDTAHFAIIEGDTRYLGMATAWLGSGQGRIASYWISERLFQRTLISDLLLAVLGTVVVAEDSRFAERKNQPHPVDSHQLWAPAALVLETPMGAPAHRFALKLPEGWRAVEIEHEKDRGWLLILDGHDPGKDGMPVVVVDGDDLEGTLEETIHRAIGRLNAEGVYEVEVPPHPLEIQGQPSIVQLWRGRAPAAPDFFLRLWSLGLRNESSAVHMVAIGDAEGLEGWMPTLAAIGDTIRVLPRVPDPERMASMVGRWRYRHRGDTDAEIWEVRLELEAEGGFRRLRVVVDPREAALTSSQEPMEGLEDEGRWDIVHEVLTLHLADGSRERHTIETIAEGTALLDQTIWQRL